jgi:hypothetical protein
MERRMEKPDAFWLIVREVETKPRSCKTAGLQRFKYNRDQTYDLSYFLPHLHLLALLVTSSYCLNTIW